MLSELKRSGQGQNITFTVGQSFKRGIIFCYLKWKREHKDLEIEQLMSADTADKILSSDWIVSLNLCSDLLVKLLKEEFQKWRHTDRHTDKLIWQLVELLTFAVKKRNIQNKAILTILNFSKLMWSIPQMQESGSWPVAPSPFPIRKGIISFWNLYFNPHSQI